MRKIYAEAGIGNGSFFSTEYEDGENEYRVPRFVKPNKVEEYYFRVWVLKTVFIISTKDKFKISQKSCRKFKFLFGIGGRE